MNLFELVLKQMRQRALSTWLTLLSVVLGVGLAVAILVFQREGDHLFGQSDFGYDVLVGPKGSKLQLVLNTVYHLSASPGNVPYSLFERLEQNHKPQMRWAVPMSVGDNYEGYRIVASNEMLLPTDHEGNPNPEGKVFEYRPGRTLQIADGRAYHPLKFEAVIGQEVARRTGLKVGDTFKPTHGLSNEGTIRDEHEELWTVTGILAQTFTANDRVIFIPLVSFYAIPEHEKGLEAIANFQQGQQRTTPPAPAVTPGTTAPAPRLSLPKPSAHDDHDHGNLLSDDHGDHAGHAHEHAYDLNPDGTIDLHLDKSKWMLSAIAVRARPGGHPALSLIWAINNGPDAMAVNPASEMREFFSTYLKGSGTVLLMISLLVTIVAAISILVSIYNAVSARLGEIAILRALGATRTRILTLICVEAGVVGLVGGMLGLVVGHLLAGVGSLFLQRLLGQGIRWMSVGQYEWLYLGAVVVLAVLAGLVPAMKAYRTPVAVNLAGV